MALMDVFTHFSIIRRERRGIRPEEIKPLYGRDELRLRVGKYRVLFFEDRDNNLYVITTIKPRGDVYK